MEHTSMATSKPQGSLLFWVCLCLMVSPLQTLVPNDQKHTVRQTASTPPTELQTTAFTRADPGHGDGGTFGCGNKSGCDTYCSVCSSLRTQECYEGLVVHWCRAHFNLAMEAMNSSVWCSLETVKVHTTISLSALSLLLIVYCFPGRIILLRAYLWKSTPPIFENAPQRH